MWVITKVNRYDFWEIQVHILKMLRTLDRARRRERDPRIARVGSPGTHSADDHMGDDDTNIGVSAVGGKDTIKSLLRKIVGQSCIDHFTAYRIFWLLICLAVLFIAASAFILAREFDETFNGARSSGNENDGNDDFENDRLRTAILEWGFTSRESLNDPDSPQGQALRWLSDGGKETENLDVARTRFSLAAIYFSTNYVQQESGSSSAWYQQSNWMSSNPVCVWHGVICLEEETSRERVHALNLSSNGLAGYLPPEIGLLMGDIQSLDLGNNAIEGTIPEELSNLRNLGTCCCAGAWFCLLDLTNTFMQSNFFSARTFSIRAFRSQY